MSKLFSVGRRVGCSVADAVDVLNISWKASRVYLVFILVCSGTDIQGKRWSSWYRGLFLYSVAKRFFNVVLQ